MSIDVFISYRGADRVLARKLEQRLRSRWGSRVFRDETGLMPGQSWSDQLNDAVKDAKVMLALVGPGWYVRAEGEGEDWVRAELLGAVRSGIPVLPVLIGDPKRLTTLPEAFTNQAVTVSEDLAGFDLQEIEKRLRSLGAFEDRGNEGFGKQRSNIVPVVGVERALAALDAGRSVLVTGASGSGRTALLQQIAARQQTHRATGDANATEDGTRVGGNAQDGPDRNELDPRSFVATYGIDQSARNRRTHGVVASWIDGLCTAIRGLSTQDERETFGRMLVKAVIDRGPDLIGREVLRPAWLLPLGDDQSDRKILEAARRPIDRWAPFPPERLVSQSLAVLEQFAAKVDRPLTLIVDNVESIDGSSADLVRHLVQSPSDRIRLVLATSVMGADCSIVGSRPSKLTDLRDELGDPRFSLISLEDPDVWGERGAIIETWLKRNNVRLGKGLGERFDGANPYYALSALWYLVDNGHLVEPKNSLGDDERVDTDGVVVWVQAKSDEELEIPSRDRLLDHMVEEFVPIRFRNVIAAGALIGRTFPFSAAFATASPPTSVDEKPIDGRPPNAEEIARWQQAGDDMWAQLSKVDPDGSVISCHLSVDRERKISLAQVDLVAHFAQRSDLRTTWLYHERLATYFTAPIAKDVGQSLDDRYSRAEAAATHWTLANRSREAADAERIAAGLAEQALAYHEARAHYRRAIRLFTQLLAEHARKETVSLVEHEDMLILANCLYRLGQMTRLANERASDADGSDPTAYFDHALVLLAELSSNLHDKRLAAPASPGTTTASPRDIPEPNILRHYIRLCEALRGYVNLELAEWYELENDPARSRELLFETLRHAEAARGEAGSRWLLAATSARLAQQLVTDADRGSPPRTGARPQPTVRGVVPDRACHRAPGREPRRGTRPRRPALARAWSVLGQIFQYLEVEPRLAEWAFRRMNEHRRDVSDMVDMMTDQQLGVFLLSVCRGVPDDTSDAAASPTAEARALLEGYARWATESGIAHAQSGAYLNLALQTLVEQADRAAPDLAEAHRHVEMAIKSAADDRQKADAQLLSGVLYVAESCRPDGSLSDEPRAVSALKKADLRLPQDATSDDLLQAGWRAGLLKWLPIRPQLKDMARSVAEQWFARELADEESELADAFRRAEQYLERLSGNPRVVPSNDQAIWKLLEGRVPQECLDHAERARTKARLLLTKHRAEWSHLANDEVALLARDLEYAVAVHDWYRSTDPSRLLTLARESNASISGAEWASPNLLRGRLALQVLDHQYAASAEIGQERFTRITSMVKNRAIGSSDVGPLDQIFYLASEMSEPDHRSLMRTAQQTSDWRELAVEPGRLREAYLLAVGERNALVRQAGLPLVQDLHLLDAALPPFADTPDVTNAGRGTADQTAAETVNAPT